MVWYVKLIVEIRFADLANSMEVVFVDQKIDYIFMLSIDIVTSWS